MSRGLLAAVGFLFVTSIACGQTVVYVDANAAGPVHDGTSWPDAFDDLQDALDVAGDGDQIWVAVGTYTPSDWTDPYGPRWATFQLLSGVALYGGFDGTESALEDRAGLFDQTILSGDLDGDDDFVTCIADEDCSSNGRLCAAGLCIIPDNNVENSYHVVTGTGTSETALLDGFTITSGNPDANVAELHLGGGMINYGGSPTLSNCTFSGNAAAYFGGGMYNDGGSPTLTNCTFSGNAAYSMGGGIYNVDSSPTLTDCIFSNNSAESDGGGVYSEDNSSPTLTNCTFSGNAAGHYAGGMYNDGGSPTLINCTFSDNSADSGTGGMFNDGGSPMLNSCTFIGNTAHSLHGGGMVNVYSSPTLNNCTFSDNSAQFGGGISNYESSPALNNCTFRSNSATSGGGGMHNHESDPTLTNCTFSGNSATGRGGGMFNIWSNPTLISCTFNGNSAWAGGAMSSQYDSIPMLTNCILWGDSPDELSFTSSAPIALVTYSDIQGGWEGEGNISADPLFVDPEFGDLHLQAGSPCIDAGDPGFVPSDATDLDGELRVFAGRVDMGADEYHDCDGNGIPDYQDVNDCIIIVSSYPEDGDIDARQPSEMDGSSPVGWQSLAITFDGDPTGLDPADFAVFEQGGDGFPPAVLAVSSTPNPHEVDVVLSSPIEPGAWTTITHNNSGSSVRLGYLPADANGDATVSPTDILALIDALNGITTLPACSTDIDRSDETNPADILRLIDLLNGAGAFEPWNGRSLPE